MLKTDVLTIAQILEQAEQDGYFRLPVGFKDEKGEVHREFEIGDMTGEADEAIADPKIRNNFAKVMSKLIAVVTSRVGTLPRVKDDVVKKMFEADRGFIVLMNYIVNIASGDKIKWTHRCSAQHCASEYDVDVDFGKIEVHYLADGEDTTLVVDLPNGIKRADKTYKRIRLSLPRGDLMERVGSAVGGNTAQAVTTILAAITVEVEGLQNFLFTDFQRMTKRDRIATGKFIGEQKMGPIMTGIQCQCPECGNREKVTIPAVALLGEI